MNLFIYNSMDTASPSSGTVMRSARENKMRENHDSEKNW